MTVIERFAISYEARHYADVDWARKADRWTATFYLPDETVGTAVITRVIPGVTPNPREALATDPGLLDRIPRVIFAEDGQVVPELRAVLGYEPAVLLLLESVEVEQGWRGRGVGMQLAVTALRRLAGGPRTVAVCYPAPIHDHGPDEPCSYDSDDPEVRQPDEEAMAKLRAAWERHGFKPLGEGVYAMAL
jgi:GNAT superfamily N-acetyltransferase